MSDVPSNQEAWKSAWIEFFVEMVALDPVVESGGADSLEAAQRMVQNAKAIEKSLVEG